MCYAKPTTSTPATNQPSITKPTKASSPLSYNLVTPYEHFSFAIGLVILIVMGPVVGCCVGASMVWEACDRSFRGGFVESGNELSGVLISRVVPWFNRLTHSLSVKMVKHKERRNNRAPPLPPPAVHWPFHVIPSLPTHLRSLPCAAAPPTTQASPCSLPILPYAYQCHHCCP